MELFHHLFGAILEKPKSHNYFTQTFKKFFFQIHIIITTLFLRLFRYKILENKLGIFLKFQKEFWISQIHIIIAPPYEKRGYINSLEYCIILLKYKR